MGKKKVEIIDISLEIDIAEEIRNKVDSLSADIIDHTKKLIRENGMKIQKTSKKKQQRKEQDERIGKVVALLEESFEIPECWRNGDELLEAADIEVTSQNLNKLSMQIQKLLKKEDKWLLSKKRKAGKTVYRLIRFS